MRFEWAGVLQRIGGADQERFELLDPGMLPVHLSTQPGINQHFFHKLAVLQLQLFDLLARFCVRFVLNLPHFKLVLSIVYRPDSLFPIFPVATKRKRIVGHCNRPHSKLLFTTAKRTDHRGP